MDVYGNGAALYDGLDEFFPGQNSEGGDDANLEWLSMLVEDCLSAAPSYSAITQHRPPLATAPSYRPPPPAAASIVSLPPQVPLEPSLLPENRGKRKLPALPLLQQRYWLSESELILQHVSMSKKATQFVSKHDSELVLNHGSTNTHKKATHFVSGDDETAKGEGQQSRRCTHCQAQKTPQWRTGPVGPKSLCNACGVRFKSGRLLPEYRPAKSPTFVSYQHSNSHKKVMEMRMRSSKESNSR